MREWHEAYERPGIGDECVCEGDISHRWGTLPGTELVRRFWEGTVRNGYIGHGECFLDPNDALWWSKGGILKGESPARISFLKQILEEGPSQGIDELQDEFSPYASYDSSYGGTDGEYYLLCFGFSQPAYRGLVLPEDLEFHIDIIDTSERTITPVKGEFTGRCQVDLLGKSYLALQITRVR